MATAGKHHHHHHHHHHARHKVPDGGYGWFVVAAMFLVFMIVAGGFFSFGVLYVALLDAFGGSQAETGLLLFVCGGSKLQAFGGSDRNRFSAWVGSLVLMVTVSTNPFSAYLAERFGYRPVAMIGGVVASIALIISSFATSLTQLYLTYGVLLGIGYSFVHLPSYIMVGRYFRKKLSIAMGIALAGSGIGQCAMAFIIQRLKESYGWRGTFMILSGVTLNLCVAAALLRPLHPTKKKKKKKKQHHEKPSDDDEVFVDHHHDVEVGQQPSKDETLGMINGFNYFKNTKNTSRFGDRPIPVAQLQAVQKIDNMLYGNNYNKSVDKSNKLYSPLSSGDDVWRHHSESSFSSIDSDSSDDEDGQAQSSLLVMAAYGSGFLWMPPPVEESTESESDSDNEERFSPEVIAEKTPEVLEETLVVKKKRWSLKGAFEKFKAGLRKGLKMLNKVMDFSLWKDPIFAVIQVGFLCHYCGQSIVTSHLVKRARDFGIPDSDGAMLVSIMGITQSVGRVLFGGIGNLRGVSPLLLYSVSASLCGVCAIVSIYLSSYTGQMVTSAFFGLFMGSYITMTPVICAKYFGPEKFRSTSAFVFQFQGLGHIIASPLGGWMRDMTGIYDSAFYISGIWLFAAGLLMLLVPYLSRREKNRALKKKQDEELEHAQQQQQQKEEQKQQQVEVGSELEVNLSSSEVVQLIVTTV